ncbi:DUF924 family protein [Sphingomicrobium nitratireducens]|uniref:DUF924 family protein n=1 Tax=Sphingomicrobium nitratireducens TaxID=2964666 RepID=UPI002240917C|nr:DUF924 family protein [Sphingomicrobium nitratireducens]
MDRRREAQKIIDFWFDEVGKSRWFAKDPVLDADIAKRYGALRDDVIASNGEGWRDGPRRLLAAILMLDQFSRNIHRGTPEAYAADPLARRLTRRALEKGWEEHYERPYLQFLYMPLMHSEDLEDQERSVELFEQLGDPQLTRFAYLHRDQIRNFGRFPGRNAALGRESTPEEQLALDDGANF